MRYQVGCSYSSRKRRSTQFLWRGRRCSKIQSKYHPWSISFSLYQEPPFVAAVDILFPYVHHDRRTLRRLDPVVLVRRIRTCTRDRRPTGKRNGQLRKRCVSWRYLQGWEQEASVTHRNLGLRFHENPEQQITKIRRRKKSGWQILVEWRMIITLKLPQI